MLEALDAVAGTPLADGLGERIDRAARRGREFLLVHRLIARTAPPRSPTRSYAA